jgi:hypothetical protein
MLARASWTAAQKHSPVKGMLAAKMIPVVRFPSSGTPEDNSKTEPTPAIAAIHEPNKNTPLFGVIITDRSFLALRS